MIKKNETSEEAYAELQSIASWLDDEIKFLQTLSESLGTDSDFKSLKNEYLAKSKVLSKVVKFENINSDERKILKSMLRAVNLKITKFRGSKNRDKVQREIRSLKREKTKISEMITSERTYR